MTKEQIPMTKKKNMRPRLVPLNPEPLETMRARFPAAIAEPFESGDCERIADPKHRFDFDDGCRLIISRDRMIQPDHEVVMVVATWLGDSLPLVTMVIARAGIHFAELSGWHGDGELLAVEPDSIVLIYRQRYCRVCGCSDFFACEGGCYWVEADLCSQCHFRATMPGPGRE